VTLRGRAGVPPPGQAAQHAARGALELLGVDDLPVLSVRRLPGPDPEVERWSVTLACPDGEVVAAVESHPSAEAGRLTCSATHDAHSRSWQVTIETHPSRRAGG
jgi:hypothetical protein